MPSSTSSSDSTGAANTHDRAVPDKSLGTSALLALVIALLLMGTVSFGATMAGPSRH